MATAQVQQAVAAPVHDNSCVKEEEEKNHQIIQETPCAEVGQQASHAKVHKDGGCTDEEGKDELEVPATGTDEGQRIAHEIEAKLHVHEGPAEAEAKEPKEGRLGRGAKKAAEKAAAKGAVVHVDDETDAEAVALAVDQAPVTAPVAPEEAAEAAGEEDARAEKAPGE